MESLSALAARTQSGDVRARIELFDRLRPYVRALAGASDLIPTAAHHQVDPSDLAQNVLIRIDRSLTEYRGTSEPEFHAWIKTILRNQAIDVLRAKDPEVSFDASGSHTGRNGHPVDDSTPSGNLMRAERVRQVAEALERLPEDQRNAVRWRHFDQLPLQEIGRRLGNRSADAAAQLIHRGIARLHELLSRHEELNDS
jgi:RNA polymerase sigma-70 factor, ECF subfamily